MTGFGWGTIGLWTVARGWRTGLCLAAAMPVVQLAMAVLNGAPLDGYGVSNIVFRSILGLINFVVPFLIYLAARRTARAIIEEARRAGDLAERVATLRSLHDSAIADLDAIVLIAGRDRISVAERFRLIAEAAEGQAALLATTHGATAGGSAVELIAMVTAFAQRGLPVELSGPVSILDGLAPAVQEALLNASREALHNCLKYSGAPGAALRIRTDHHDVEIEIRDQGMGFAPGQPVGFGIEESISSRLRAVGGEAVVTSKAGSGTSVLLRVAEGANTPRQSDIAVVFRWFPIVPLAARLFVLPLALYKTEPLLAGNPVPLRLIVAGIALAHLAVIALLLRRSWQSWPHTALSAGLAADLLVTGGLYLAVAASLGAGQIATSDGDTVWIYVFLTAPLWFALQRPRGGLCVALSLLGLLPLGVLINRVQSGGNWGVVIICALQVLITAGYAAMVARMAQRSVRQAAASSARAGREAARLILLTEVRPRLMVAISQLASLARDGRGDVVLSAIRRLARGEAAELRRLLQNGSYGDASDVVPKLEDGVEPALWSSVKSEL